MVGPGTQRTADGSPRFGLLAQLDRRGQARRPARADAVRVDDFGHRYDGVVDEAGQESELAGIDAADAVHFLSGPIPAACRRQAPARWRQRCFVRLDRMASDPVVLLELPRGRTVVIGRDVGL